MSLTFSDMFNPLNFSGNKPDNFSLFSIDSAIITIGGPLGQLFMRFKYFNGSLDKLWLLLFPLFWIPPFSFIPVLWANFGWIHKIPISSGSPLDIKVLLPIIAKLLLPLIVDDNSTLGLFGQFVTTMYILLTMFFITLWQRKDIINSLTCNVNIISIVGRSLAEAMFQFACATLPAYILRLIPFQGLLLDAILDAPVIGSIIKNGLWIGGYIFGYIFTNLYNMNFARNPCNPSYGLDMVVASLAFIVACLFNFADMIPGLNLLI